MNARGAAHAEFQRSVELKYRATCLITGLLREILHNLIEKATPWRYLSLSLSRSPKCLQLREIRMECEKLNANVIYCSNFFRKANFY